MKSANYPSRSKQNCCASWSRRSSSAWATTRRGTRTSACWRPPTVTCRRKSVRAAPRRPVLPLNVLEIRSPPVAPKAGGHPRARRALSGLVRVRGRRRDSRSLNTGHADCLTEYSWPGNVRQLRNVIRRACILATSESIRPEDLDRLPRNRAPAARLDPLDARRHRTAGDRADLEPNSRQQDRRRQTPGDHGPHADQQAATLSAARGRVATAADNFPNSGHHAARQRGAMYKTERPPDHGVQHLEHRSHAGEQRGDVAPLPCEVQPPGRRRMRIPAAPELPKSPAVGPSQL